MTYDIYELSHNSQYIFFLIIFRIIPMGKICSAGNHSFEFTLCFYKPWFQIKEKEKLLESNHWMREHSRTGIHKW